MNPLSLGAAPQIMHVVPSIAYLGASPQEDAASQRQIRHSDLVPNSKRSDLLATYLKRRIAGQLLETAQTPTRQNPERTV